MATTINNTSPAHSEMTGADSALLLNMAATVSKQFTDIPLEKAIAIAKQLHESGFTKEVGLTSDSFDRQNTKKTKKVKKPGPKRAKNAYMFYLASVRTQITQELQAIKQANQSLETIQCPHIKTFIQEDTESFFESESNIKVALVTKVAGKRWNQLSPEQQLPFQEQAKADLAQKKLEFDNLSNNHT